MWLAQEKGQSPKSQAASSFAFLESSNGRQEGGSAPPQRLSDDIVKIPLPWFKGTEGLDEKKKSTYIFLAGETHSVIDYPLTSEFALVSQLSALLKKEPE